MADGLWLVAKVLIGYDRSDDAARSVWQQIEGNNNDIWRQSSIGAGHDDGTGNENRLDFGASSLVRIITSLRIKFIL
jgi:hypothetical protein